MRATDCVPERFSKVMLGSLALAAALAFIILGITLLPVIGFIMAVPLIVLAVYIFRLHLNDQCEIDFPAD